MSLLSTANERDSSATFRLGSRLKMSCMASEGGTLHCRPPRSNQHCKRQHCAQLKQLSPTRSP
jgi:hypothetical protein